MKKIIIIGNSIGADILYGYLNADERYEIVCFAVDSKFINESKKFGLDVIDLKNLEKLFPKEKHKVILGIGYDNLNQTRSSIFKRIKQIGYELETYIHESAVVHQTALIGEGSLVLSNSVIEPFSKIGENTFVWSNCTIAHHSSIGSHCWIASNSVISGEAMIKNHTFIGVTSTIVNGITIGEFNIIGAGCLITKNTKSKDVYLNRSSEKIKYDSISYSKYFLK